MPKFLVNNQVLFIVVFVIHNCKIVTLVIVICNLKYWIFTFKNIKFDFTIPISINLQIHNLGSLNVSELKNSSALTLIKVHFKKLLAYKLTNNLTLKLLKTKLTPQSVTLSMQSHWNWVCKWCETWMEQCHSMQYIQHKNCFWKPWKLSTLVNLQYKSNTLQTFLT